ncbi:MAG: response regulator [Candidatus Obscuribacterales bacterium]|nr:response regulator [Candidatus Obscuribacterales bacterium]
MRVLVVEDDLFLQEALKLGLENAGYAVDAVANASEAKASLREISYDLLLLDLGLPDTDGVEVLKALRKEEQSLPVIIITARDSVEDKISGLDCGANDYISKPFDFRELEARIRALLRKHIWSNKIELVHGPVRFITNSREVLIAGVPAELTPREVAVLELLLQKTGRLVRKRQLIEQIANWEEEPSDNAIEIIIHRLRRKLEPAAVRISTVRGFGYMLEEWK